MALAVPDGAPTAMGELRDHTHRIYVLLDVPTAPWQQAPYQPNNLQLPWTDILDHGCRWAAPATIPDDAAARITRKVYDLGPGIITYDCPGGGSTHYANPGFDCTAFLDRLGGGVGNGQYVNCTDCATIVSVFANAVGADLWQSQITVQGARYFEHLERLTGRLDVHIATLPA
jgi:hypothetical protein